MKCDAAQLPRQLRAPLKPVYLLHGDEALLQQEALDAIRQAARREGFGARERHDLGKGDDWQPALSSTDNLSLFAERTLLEIHAQHKPDAATGKLLDEWLQNPPPDTLLLLTLPRLDAQAQKSRWFTACDSAGLVVSCQPLGAAEQLDWLQARLQRAGLQADREALAWLRDQTEGNLLAASQEVIKLRMLHGEGALTLAQIQAAVSGSARYDLFDLGNTALAGDAGKTARVFHGLLAEGQAESLILWVLAREIRTLLAVAEGQRQGLPLGQLWQQHGVWNKSQPLMAAALKRLSAKHLQRLGEELLAADLAIKGQSPENPRDVLLRLCLGLAGVTLFHAAD